MPDTPPESGVSPPTPKVNVAPAPAADSHAAPASPDGGESWSFRIGEVLEDRGRGSYTVKERLGRGGMGEVYRAEFVSAAPPKFVQVFALKVLRPNALVEYVRTFIDEVHLLSLLRHDSIAHYHGFFIAGGQQVLVMEFVEGRSLHAILELARRKRRTLCEPIALELLAQIAEALFYAHTAEDAAGNPLNIVHRDVSPGNIMVTSAGSAKLVDFGVAQADLDERTQILTGVPNARGKVPYLSPEALEVKPLDARSDLFSLCSVLVEMLTGEPPFGRAARYATARSIMDVTPSYVDLITRGLSRKVRAICQKALAHDPGQRFSNGREMAKAMLAKHLYQGPAAVLEEIAALEALPEAAEREATAVRRAKWVRRAVVVAGALAVAALPALLWSAHHARPAAAAPHEQPMSPIATAEGGNPTVQDEMKSQAPAPTGWCAAASYISKVLPFLAVLSSAACVHIHTGAKAGDCTHAVVREFEGKRVPDVIKVVAYEGPWVSHPAGCPDCAPGEPPSVPMCCLGPVTPSNAKGFCTGPWDTGLTSRDEPCPISEGDTVVMRIENMGGADDWFGPAQNADTQPALLIGKTHIFEATGTYDTLWGHGPRNVSGRMTALITEIQTWDGKKVPVCGVLFGNDNQEGVPIFSSPYYPTPTGGAWRESTVRLFWTSP